MPINLRVFRWDEDRGYPGEWRHLRQRWDRLHNARVLPRAVRGRAPSDLGAAFKQSPPVLAFLHHPGRLLS